MRNLRQGIIVRIAFVNKIILTRKTDFQMKTIENITEEYFFTTRNKRVRLY
jgi:hypothetical protein